MVSFWQVKNKEGKNPLRYPCPYRGKLPSTAGFVFMRGGSPYRELEGSEAVRFSP